MAHPASTVPRRRLALAAALFALAAGTASAADFPQRPVRMVVPYAAGGGTDVVARALAQAMTGQLPQPVVVENRAGAGGMLGAESVARSAHIRSCSPIPATPCCASWRPMPASISSRR